MAGYSVTYTVVDNATKQIDLINRRMTAMRAPMERLSKQVQRFVDVSGLRRIAQGFEWIGNAAQSVLRTLTSIVPVLGALTGAATLAGMVKLVSSFAAWSQELTSTADSLGVTTQQMQQFQDATRLAGGNAEDMTSAMQSLHKAQGDFMVGKGGDATVWANKLGINFRDASGHARSLADLMPEVLEKVAAIKNPYDRAAASQAFFGDGTMKLIETIRRARGPFSQYMSDANRYISLTKEQLDALQAFTEAQGRLGVTFDVLGQQISATLAKNFTPLMNKLSEFVEKHTPEILAAVDQISARFATWLENVDWTKVQDGVVAFGTAIKDLVGDLDRIVRVAEIIAAIFITKWGVQAVAAVVQLTTALGSIGAGTASAVAGSGLLGALGQVAAVAAAVAAAGAAKGALEKGSEAVERGIFGDQRTDERKQLQEGGYRQIMRWLGNPFGLGTGPDTPPGPMNLPEDNVKRGAAIRDQLSKDLNLPGQSAAGIVGNLQAESGLAAVQEKNPISGRGGFGWAQWTGPRREAFERYARENGLDPKSDEANYGFLRKELQGPEYAGMLERMRKDPAHAATIFEREFERPAVSNAGTREAYAAKYAAVPAAAPPATVAPGGGGIGGKVDVAITGKNLPPDTAVTAKGSGAVNVPPPRVEHQELASV